MSAKRVLQVSLAPSSRHTRAAARSRGHPRLRPSKGQPGRRLGAGPLSHLASASRSLTGGSAPSTQVSPNSGSCSCLGNFLTPGRRRNNRRGNKNQNFHARIDASSFTPASRIAGSAKVRACRTGPRAKEGTNWKVKARSCSTWSRSTESRLERDRRKRRASGAATGAGPGSGWWVCPLGRCCGCCHGGGCGGCRPGRQAGRPCPCGRRCRCGCGCGRGCCCCWLLLRQLLLRLRPSPPPLGHDPGEAVQNENGRPLPRSRQTAAHRGTATTRFPEQLQGCTNFGKSTARPPKQGKRQSLVATRIELPRWCVAGRLPTEKAVGHPGGLSPAGTVARGARPPDPVDRQNDLLGIKPSC